MHKSLLFLPLIANAAPLSQDAKTPGRLLLATEAAAEMVALETPAPHITQAYFLHDERRSPITIGFNPDATEVKLHIPEDLILIPGPIALEVADRSTIFPDGRVVFSALDSKVVGKTAKLETHPGNHRIGYWSKIEDHVVWDFKPTTWGMYYVDLTYSLASKKSDIEITLADKSLKATIPSTGSWYQYTTAKLGKIYLAQDKPTTLTVKGLKKYGKAVMNLKAVTLRPAPEGDQPIATAAKDGTITLMANQSTVYGEKLRYEPQPKKLCVGYWTIPTDYVTWDFRIDEPGDYEIELFQGCGKGQGGSKVDLIVGKRQFTFEVEDTGHFQNFVPRRFGILTLLPGTHRLEIRPQYKVKGAVMDVQKIILHPKR